MASSPQPTPQNPHLTDPLLAPFLSPTFSPTAYLNSHLPPPQSKPTISTQATKTQSHISALSAQTTHLTTTLTTLTDEILRTSSRLAYEVELLRGEAITLAETLTSNSNNNNNNNGSGIPPASLARFIPDPTPPATSSVSEPGKQHDPLEPAALPRLRTLHHVRSHLQSTIRTFNLALSFPFPPSLLPSSGSLNNVSAPDTANLEARGQAALARLKGEVIDLMRAGEGERARERVAELGDAVGVWRGTGEERARAKWVKGLEILVGGEEEGEREEEKVEVAAGGGVKGGREGGTGFLRRLRDEIYLE